MESKTSIQDYLSLGYVYLLILGIIRDTIYYSFLNVNILEYSSILDVLLSPLVYIANNLKVIAMLGLIAVLIYWLSNSLPKMIHNLVSSNWYRKRFKVEEPPQKQFKKQSAGGYIWLMAIAILGFYLGSGVSSGYKMRERIENQQFEVNSRILFSSGELKEIKAIGQNSEYIFYILKGSKNVNISPIKGNIKIIEKIRE